MRASFGYENENEMKAYDFIEDENVTHIDSWKIS